jgi:hypothetical protein
VVYYLLKGAASGSQNCAIASATHQRHLNRMQRLCEKGQGGKGERDRVQANGTEDTCVDDLLDALLI